MPTRFACVPLRSGSFNHAPTGLYSDLMSRLRAVSATADVRAVLAFSLSRDTQMNWLGLELFRNN
jgi:hypothetical protein